MHYLKRDTSITQLATKRHANSCSEQPGCSEICLLSSEGTYISIS